MGELKAILIELQVVNKKGWMNIIICSDLKQVVELIWQDIQVKDDNYLLVEIFWALRLQTHKIKLEFEPRGANRVADCLARSCRTNVSLNYVRL